MRIHGTPNAGDATGEGVELELAAQLGGQWEFNLAAAYNHNEFDRVREGTGFTAGERLPNSPEKNISAGLQYDFDLGSQWSGFARGDVSHVGNVVYFYDEPLTQPSYTTGNLRLSLQRGNLAVELFGRNVTDERAVVLSGDPAFGGYLYLARPREIGVELRYAIE